MTPYYADEWLTVLEGDCREVMAGMESESVHCVVTSPPYWGLRDYGTPGQLGLEPTPEEYVAAMVDVFRAVRRVLRADGTVWLNLGDSYAAGNVSGPQGASGQRATRTFTARTTPKMADGLKPKDLVGIPWRVAFALQADGWYLRSDVIWAKPNPMPESVTDRPTKAHEYVFLLSKQPRYFYDADAVREAPDPQAVRRRERGQPPSTYRNGHKSFVADQMHSDDGMPSHYGVIAANPAGRNLRSVWTIATAPYPGAHFATFPPRLVEPCIKAGTSERGVCPECGAPWERETTRERIQDHVTTRPGKTMDGPYANQVTTGDMDIRNGLSVAVTTTGWRPTCRHTDAWLFEHNLPPTVPATVLDPFAGTGTVGLVAAALSRRAVLIDLNAEYLRQCLDRNRQMPLGVA